MILLVTTLELINDIHVYDICIKYAQDNNIYGNNYYTLTDITTSNEQN